MPEQHVDGVSMVPLLKQEGKFHREAVYWHYPHYGNQGGTPACSVRMGDYKLIEFFKDGRLELYNLREDIGENNNIADKQPEMVAEMHKKLLEWRKCVNAKMPHPNMNCGNE